MKKLFTLIALLAMATPVFFFYKYASFDIDNYLKGYIKKFTIYKKF